MKFIKYNLILLCSFFLQAQDITVTESNMAKITYHCYFYFSPIADYQTYLYVTDSISQYIEFRNESVYKPEWNYEMKVNFFKIINNYNFLNNTIEENRVLKDSTKLYAKWKNDLVWEITDEEKMIGDYKVRKAVTQAIDNSEREQKAIAWFATDIPIPLGPDRYYGLPGLIVELEYEIKRIKYTLKDVDFQAKYKFIELDKENEVDKFDLIYPNHKNPKLIKQIQKENKKKKSKK